jgi:hypothetical protein
MDFSMARDSYGAQEFDTETQRRREEKGEKKIRWEERQGQREDHE